MNDKKVKLFVIECTRMNKISSRKLKEFYEEGNMVVKTKSIKHSKKFSIFSFCVKWKNAYTGKISEIKSCFLNIPKSIAQFQNDNLQYVSQELHNQFVNSYENLDIKKTFKSFH